MEALPEDVPPPEEDQLIDNSIRCKLLGLTRLKPYTFITMFPTQALYLFYRIRHGRACFNARLAHITPSQPKHCPHCGETETDEHVICHCIRYDWARYTLTTQLLTYNVDLSMDLFTQRDWPYTGTKAVAIMKAILNVLQYIRKFRPYRRVNAGLNDNDDGDDEDD